MKILRLYLGLFCWLCALPAFAQREFDTWCVGGDTCARPGGYQGLGSFSQGYGAQLKFGPAGPSLGSPVRGWSSGAYSDAQGNLLFYTNGQNVYDRRHQVMPGGQKLSDHRITQDGSGLLATFITIHPMPGHPGKCYLFYYKGDIEGVVDSQYYAFPVLYCAIVDLQANGGYGAVVRRDILIAKTNIAQMTLVRHPNNEDFWVVTRILPERGFRAYRVSAAGIAAEPVSSLAGEAAYATGGLLRASPDGRRLVSEGNRPLEGPNVWPSAAEHGVYVYDFDNRTGQVRHEVLVRRIAPWDTFKWFWYLGYKVQGNILVAGLSFSPDSRLLYVSEYLIMPGPVAGSYKGVVGASLAQYDVSLSEVNLIQQSREDLALRVKFPYAINSTAPPINGARFTDMQLASNGSIWIIDWMALDTTQTYEQCYGPKAMTQIARPNERGLGCDLRLQAFPLGPNIIDPWVLPNVVTNMLFTPTALLADITCDTVRLWANSQQTRPPGRWNFDDPDSGPANTTTGYYVAHRFRRGGPHRVTLTYPDGLVLTKDIDVPAGEADFTDANIITPNGDGLNDAFRPVRRGTLPNGARLRVYSRWGQQVFNAEGPAPEWPATGVAAGVYLWQLIYADCGGQARQRKGVVTVEF